MKKIKNAVLLMLLFSIFFLQICATNSANLKLPDSQKNSDIAELEVLGFFDSKYYGNEYQESQDFKIYRVKADKESNIAFFVFKNYKGEWCFDPYVELYAPEFAEVISGIEPSQYDKVWLLGEYNLASAIAIQVINPSTFSDDCEWIDIDGHRCIIVYFEPSTKGPKFGSWVLHSPALPGSNLMSGMLTNEASHQKFEQLASELRAKGSLQGIYAPGDILGSYGAGSWILSGF